LVGGTAGSFCVTALRYSGCSQEKETISVPESGAWAGTRLSTLQGRIEKFDSQAKWNKGRDIITSLLALFEGEPEVF
jgi:hypothetical protein